MLLQERHTSERKEEGRGKVLPAGHWWLRERRIRWIGVLQIVRYDLLELIFAINPELNLLHSLEHLARHVQAEFSHFPLFDQAPVFPLPLSSSRPDSFFLCDLLWRQVLAGERLRG